MERKRYKFASFFFKYNPPKTNTIKSNTQKKKKKITFQVATLKEKEINKTRVRNIETNNNNYSTQNKKIKKHEQNR